MRALLANRPPAMSDGSCLMRANSGRAPGELAPGPSVTAAPKTASAKSKTETDEATAEGEAEAFPWLPPELVTHVFCHLPIQAMPDGSLVCHAWRTAGAADDVWKAALRRRWDFTSLDTFGARFDSWCAVFHALRQLRPYNLHLLSEEARNALTDGALISLHALELPVRRFLLGLAMGGVFPTADGIWTYYEEGATPIHYRHKLSEAEAAELEAYDAAKVRLGGRWEWSCDRSEWYESSTTIITRGVFSSEGEWGLVEANLEVVNYLHEFPLVPLVRRECAFDAMDPHLETVGSCDASGACIPTRSSNPD
jgi:hypothetical protein